MQRSVIDRFFPAPRKSLPPQHERDYRHKGSSSRHSDSSSPQVAPLSPSQALESAKSPGPRVPLSASLIHHDDPFLPVERATSVLQNTIQSLLDLQSDALSDRLVTEAESKETASTSTGSLTHAPSHLVLTGHGSKSRTRVSASGVVPIRQPIPHKPSLRLVRRKLARAMHEFAGLKEEELRILRNESLKREDALERTRGMHERKVALQSEVESLQSEGSEDNNSSRASASRLRKEALKIESEIRELEERLSELRYRHKRVCEQAEELESAAESEISSSKGALALTEQEIRKFLRRPPVPHSLSARVMGQDTGASMYALNPERRTLEMAEEQWVSEQHALSKRVLEVQRDKDALVEGEHIWQDSFTQIQVFERELRGQTRRLAESLGRAKENVLDRGSSTTKHVHVDSVVEPADQSQNQLQPLTDKLDLVIHNLESNLATAEEKSWNLLICALGAELEAFYQAREMLQPDHPSSPSPYGHIDTDVNRGLADEKTKPQRQADHNHYDSEDNDVPHPTLLQDVDHEGQAPYRDEVDRGSNNGNTTSRLYGNSSNESLRATLDRFSSNSAQPQLQLQPQPQHHSTQLDRTDLRDEQSREGEQMSNLGQTSRHSRSHSRHRSQSRNLGSIANATDNSNVGAGAAAGAAASHHPYRDENGNEEGENEEDNDDPGPGFLLSH